MKEKNLKYEEFCKILNSFPYIIYYIDKRGNFVFVNEAIRKLGYSPEELIGKHFSSIIHPDDYKKIARKYVLPKYRGKITGPENAPKLFDERRTDGRISQDFKIRLLRKDGSKDKNLSNLTVLAIGSASGYYDKNVKAPDKKFLGSIGIIRDITKEEEMELELRRYIDILENNDELIFIKDKNGRYIYVNQTFLKYFGMKNKSEVLGKTNADILDSINYRVFSQQDKIVLKTKKMQNFINKINFRGKEYWVSTTKIPVKDKNENIIGISCFLRNITEFKVKEEELSIKNALLENFLEHALQGIIFITKDRRIGYINRFIENFCNCKVNEVLNKDYKTIFKNFDEPVKSKFITFIEELFKREEKPYFIETRQIIKNRNFAISYFSIYDENKEFMGYLLTIVDVTEKVQSEESLIITSKLNALSNLAGGVAHDFNNLLTGILANISLLRSEKHKIKEVNAILNDIEEAAKEAKSLATQLLFLTKSETPVKKVVSIKNILRSITRFILSGSNIEYKVSVPKNIYNIEADLTQIEQVFQNIILNARQAMPQGGKFKVKAENTELNENNKLGLKPGKYVKISFKDTGIGIPPENLTKIFEPYFTTKEKGSGLGLSIAYSIIEKHNGKIFVESELGKGTTFYIYLPATEKEVEIKKVKKEEKKKIIKRELKILVMDDEPLIRKTAERILTQLGHKVVTAKEGNEAIKIYKDYLNAKNPFDLVILDLTVIGGMNGEETAKRLLEIDKDVKILVSSGYYDKPIIKEYKKYGIKGVLKKPYTVEEIVEALQKFL